MKAQESQPRFSRLLRHKWWHVNPGSWRGVYNLGLGFNDTKTRDISFKNEIYLFRKRYPYFTINRNTIFDRYLYFTNRDTFLSTGDISNFDKGISISKIETSNSKNRDIYTVHKKFSTTRACRVIFLFEIIYQNKFIIWLWESVGYDVNHPFLSSGV